MIKHSSRNQLKRSEIYDFILIINIYLNTLRFFSDKAKIYSKLDFI